MTVDPLRQAAADIMTMGVSVIDVQTRLHKPTPKDEIRHKPGPHSKYCEKPCQVTHTPLDYVDARYVMDVLDEGVGPDNWQRTHVMGDGGKVICCIAIRIDGEWITKCDGAGETAIEAEKGSFSDSFKRAAVSWGIARDLYDKEEKPATSAPVQRPAATRPVAAPKPVYDGYEGEEREETNDDAGYCPDHDLPWVLKPGGTSKKTGNPYDPFYTCGFKPERGQPYCQNKPPRAWLARHEVS